MDFVSLVADGEDDRGGAVGWIDRVGRRGEVCEGLLGDGGFVWVRGWDGRLRRGDAEGREKGEGRREKGEGRREERRKKQNPSKATLISLSISTSISAISAIITVTPRPTSNPSSYKLSYLLTACWS